VSVGKKGFFWYATCLKDKEEKKMSGSNCKCSCHHLSLVDQKPKTLVDQYFSCLKTIHHTWKSHAPFSWIVYHCFFLDDLCELTEVMSRISYIAMFYVFVASSSFSFGPWFFFLPFVPFLLDLLRGFYIAIEAIREPKVEQVRKKYFFW
jgi:hypothetical protein